MAETVNREEEPQLELYSSTSGDSGSILVNPDVIAQIAGMAASEVENVSLARFSITGVLRGKEPVRGIQIRQNPDTGRYSLTCEVKMAYRTPMRGTAEKLQRHVRETVERMTGLELESVDVKIVDIYVEPKKGREDEE